MKYKSINLLLFLIFYAKEIIKYFKDFFHILCRYRFFYYFKFLLDRNTNPSRDRAFQNFINKNKAKWASQKIHSGKKKDTILVTSWIHSHPAYAFSEAIIGRHLNEYFQSDMIGLIKNRDFNSEIIFRSYGIDKFIYLNELNFIKRLKYFFKAVKIIDENNSINQFLKINIDGVDYGKTVYEHIVRFTGKGTLEKIDFKFYYFLAKSLYVGNFFKKVREKYNISSVVQSESQFIPCAISFQYFLDNNYKIYSRHGGGKKTSVRVYCDKSEAYTIRAEASKKTFEYISNNYKEIAVKKGEDHIMKRFSGSLGNEDTGSSAIAHRNKKLITKEEICKSLGWDVRKEIVCIFGHALIDGNFLNGWRIFRDNLTWLRETLYFILNINKYNWFIKPHPMEIEYPQSKTNTLKEFNTIIAKANHIKILPNNISHMSLINIVDYAVTNNGSVPLEFASLGKKSLMAGRSDFSEIVFKDQLPKNKKEYFEKLENFEKVPKISQEQIDNAKIYTFLQWHYNLIENPLNPEFFEPNLFIDAKKFWKDAAEQVEKYSHENDYLKKMLIYQLENKLRHTPNLRSVETQEDIEK